MSIRCAAMAPTAIWTKLRQRGSPSDMSCVGVELVVRAAREDAGDTLHLGISGGIVGEAQAATSSRERSGAGALVVSDMPK